MYCICLAVAFHGVIQAAALAQLEARFNGSDEPSASPHSSAWEQCSTKAVAFGPGPHAKPLERLSGSETYSQPQQEVQQQAQQQPTSRMSPATPSSADDADAGLAVATSCKSLPAGTDREVGSPSSTPRSHGMETAAAEATAEKSKLAQKGWQRWGLKPQQVHTLVQEHSASSSCEGSASCSAEHSSTSIAAGSSSSSLTHLQTPRSSSKFWTLTARKQSSCQDAAAAAEIKSLLGRQQTSSGAEPSDPSDSPPPPAAAAAEKNPHAFGNSIVAMSLRCRELEVSCVAWLLRV